MNRKNKTAVLSLAAVMLLSLSGMVLSGCTASPVNNVPPEPSHIQEQKNVSGSHYEKKPVLYVGTPGAGFTEREVDADSVMTDGKVSIEGLIRGIADETGWNLSLSEPVTEKNGRVYLSFDESSDPGRGLPDKQKKAYEVNDKYAFIQLVMDSIQMTADMNFNRDNLNNPVDIYFSIEGKPVKTGKLTIPCDKPWNEARSLDFGK